MKKNLLFAAAVLAVAAGLFLLLQMNRGSGAEASVRVADSGGFTLPLDTDGVFRYTAEETGALLPFTLEVKDGQIRFVDSVCPDHVCEGYGWLSHTFDEAICMPARVVVSIDEAQ